MPPSGLVEARKRAVLGLRPSCQIQGAEGFCGAAIGAGEHGGLVIAVALAGWWASRSPMSSGGHPGATPLAAGLAITKRRSRNVAEVSFQICQRIVGAIQKGNHSGDEKISLSLDPFNICWPEVMC